MRLLERVKQRIERGENPPRRDLPAEKGEFPKALFLDTNKWIELSRLHYQTESGNEQHRPALGAIAAAVKSDRLIVPITVMNLSEVAKGGKQESRQRLAEFMVGLSGNFSAVPNADLDELEIDEALRKVYFEVAPTRAARRSLIRWGTRTVFSTRIALPEDPDPRVTRAARGSAVG